MSLKMILRFFLSAVLCVLIAACSASGKRGMSGGENNHKHGYTASTTEADAYQDTASIAQHKQQLAQQNTIYFAFDRSEIKPAYQDILTAYADFLRKNPSQKIVIQGHTDERGTPEYNVALGERRAKSVERYLLAQGVSPTQVTTVSYGEEKPMDSSHNESAYAKNRRAVLVYEG